MIFLNSAPHKNQMGKLGVSNSISMRAIFTDTPLPLEGARKHAIAGAACSTDGPVNQSAYSTESL